MNVVIIGCGNMGSALARRLSSKCSLTLCNRSSEKGIKLAQELNVPFEPNMEKALLGADWVILAIKPKDLSTLKLSFKKNQVLFSVLSGAKISKLKQMFKEPQIVRMMPNTAVSIGKGIVGFAQEGDLEEKTKKEIEEVFTELGLLSWIPENKMEAFAAFAASSPAFIFLMMEAMLESGVLLGFSAKDSKEIVGAVFEGCAALLKKSSHPADLKLQITSPGGTTIEGIYALEAGGVRAAIFEAMQATYQKGIQMSHE